MIRAAAVQFEHRAADKAHNFAKVESFARSAASDGVQILAFPECCITGYWFLRKLSRAALEDLAEAVPDGPSVCRLAQLAGDLRLTLGAGLIERDGAALYNTYVVAPPNGDIRRHR